MKLNIQYTDYSKNKYEVTHLIIDTDYKAFLLYRNNTQDTGYCLRAKSEIERMVTQCKNEKYIAGDPQKANIKERTKK